MSYNQAVIDSATNIYIFTYLQAMKQWWEMLAGRSPNFGYFVNPSKIWLVVKECYLESAKAIFKETGVNVTTDGKVYLGSFIGPYHMKDLFV